MIRRRYNQHSVWHTLACGKRPPSLNSALMLTQRVTFRTHVRRIIDPFVFSTLLFSRAFGI